ncbi:MAG: DUF6069 family protein [Trueperaceae bacterium]|nr:DUF6069 family protein [Trueperaceae bacterium]
MSDNRSTQQSRQDASGQKPTPNAPEQVAYRRLLWLAPVAAVIAAVANGIFFLVGDALGAFPDSVIIPNAGSPMTIGPMMIFSAVSTLGAAAVFALLGRFTGKTRRNFWIVSAVVFIGFLFTPFTIPDAPVIMIVALEVSHLIVAVVAMGALLEFGFKKDA